MAVALFNRLLGGAFIDEGLRQNSGWETALDEYFNALNVREAEFEAMGDGASFDNGSASGGKVWRMTDAGGSVIHSVMIGAEGDYDLVISYNNVGDFDDVTVLLNNQDVGGFQTLDAGDPAVFINAGNISLGMLSPGSHDIEIRMDTAGEFDLDKLTLVRGAALNVEARGSNVDGQATLASIGDIQPVIDEAIQIWSEKGADREALSRVTFAIADYADTRLGFAAGNTVWIDADAAGYGWQNRSEQETPEDSERIDLLTVLLHELGHVLGREHADFDDELMSATLRLGSQDDWASGVDAFFDTHE